MNNRDNHATHNADNEPLPTLTKWQMLAYGGPSVGLVFLTAPMGVLQGIYAKYFGIPLAVLAGVLLLSRLFDAVIDPLIGFVSDRYRVRTGTRKPFVLAGSLGLIVCSYFLFVPPVDVSVAYFTFWIMVFYVASTIKHIPLTAWGSEITAEPKERTAIFAVYSFMGKVGSFLFYFVPFLPMFTSTEITPETLKVSVMLATILILPSLYFALKYVPNGPPAIVGSTTKKSKSVAFNDLVSAFKCNKPFQIYMAAYACYGLGMGMQGGLFFLFVDSYLGQGEVFASISLVGLGLGLVFTPVAYKLAILWGKKRLWFIATCLLIASMLYMTQLSPDKDATAALLIAFMVIGLGGVCLSVVIMPMLSETIDYSLLSDKTERRGVYFAALSFMIKAEGALGLALGLAIAGWLGFDATANTHNETSGFAIRMAMVWIPCAILCVSLFFIWLSPLNERRSMIIARRLARDAERSEEFQSQQSSNLSSALNNPYLKVSAPDPSQRIRNP